MKRVVIIGTGREALLQQCRLARERVLLDREIRLCAGDVGARAGGLRPQLGRLELRFGELGLRLLERDLERRRVDPEQHVALSSPALPLRTNTCWIGPVTCALTETMSCFTCASSVDTLPPLVS